MKHQHHIKPKHRGGTNEKSNLVELSITQHAMWHFAEWQFHGLIEDYLAWRGLAGVAIKEEIVVELMRLGREKGRKSALKTTLEMIEEGRHTFQQPEIQRKAIESSQRTQRILIEQGLHNLQNPEMRARKAIIDSDKRKKEWEIGTNPLQQKEVIAKRRVKSSHSRSTQNTTQVICPHCGRIGGYTNMKRYHFDKCKFLLTSPL